MVQGIVQRLTWLVLCGLLISGCSPGRPGLATGDTGEGATLPAVRALMTSSQTAFADGDFERAAEDLERALRLDSRDPILWHELARVRRAQRQHAEAESLALRSISLCAGNADLERRNWELIAESRRARGDEAGAAEARAHIDG